MGRKKWKAVAYDKARAVELASECDTDVFAVLLLLSRGIDTAEKINAFLSPAQEPFSSPFLIEDMDIAVGRITAAIENDEKILVYGDYDADGVTATAVLYSYLCSAGASADYFIPSRTEDGYGISDKTAEMIVAKGYDLVITVDNGISSIKEAAFLKRNGIDLIVTDHHTVGDELPDCVAVVNPHRPDDNSPEKNFAGCGVAFKLICALEGGDDEFLGDEFLDLVTLGTIADIVPLTGENRTIVRRGLPLISNSSRPGVVRLLEKISLSGKELSSSDVAFQLAPKINAAGRIYDASLALDLLLCEDYEEADILVEKMLEANSKRQTCEQEILESIEQGFESSPALRTDKIIVASGSDYHPGVIGIAAARLVDKYCRPAFVITTDGTGIAKGSARSTPGFPLYEALFSVSDLLERFGGHAQAAGFALKDENIPLFRRRINEYALPFEDIFPVLSIDCRLNADKLGTAICDSLELLQPFGADNPEPVFGLYDMRVAAIRALKDNKHIRVTLTHGGAAVNAVYFGMSTDAFAFSEGDLVDVAVKVGRNEYRGTVSLSVQIKDVRPAGADEDGLFASLCAYYNFCSGAVNEETKKILCPDRLFISSVYRLLRQSGSFAFPPEILCHRLGVTADNTGMAQICLDALTELKLINREGDRYTVSPSPVRADLTDSVILQKLGYKDVQPK